MTYRSSFPLPPPEQGGSWLLWALAQDPGAFQAWMHPDDAETLNNALPGGPRAAVTRAIARARELGEPVELPVSDEEEP